jgi:hypothetical protein
MIEGESIGENSSETQRIPQLVPKREVHAVRINSSITKSGHEPGKR